MGREGNSIALCESDFSLYKECLKSINAHYHINPRPPPPSPPQLKPPRHPRLKHPPTIILRTRPPQSLHTLLPITANGVLARVRVVEVLELVQQVHGAGLVVDGAEEGLCGL